jgi:hypothetical protein
MPSFDGRPGRVAFARVDVEPTVADEAFDDFRNEPGLSERSAPVCCWTGLTGAQVSAERPLRVGGGTTRRNELKCAQSVHTRGSDQTPPPAESRITTVMDDAGLEPATSALSRRISVVRT